MRQDNLAWPMQPLAAIIGGVMLFSLALAKENSPVPVHKERLREGTHRISFVMEESGLSIGVLENLALDRIFRVLRENRGRTQWVVSGTITEYNETNYLLLTKAVQLGKPAPQDSAKPSGIGTRLKVDYPVPPGKVPAEKNVEKKPESSHDRP